MSKTYKKIEIVGTSSDSVTDAMRNGVRRTAETTRHLAWVEVTEVRGRIDGDAIAEFQVGMKVGFGIED